MNRLLVAFVLAGVALQASAGTFITDPNSSLPANTRGTKSNIRPIPVGGDPTKYIQAQDFNEHTTRLDAANSALVDVRNHVSGWVNAKSYGLTQGGLAAAAAAAVSAGKGVLVGDPIAVTTTLSLPAVPVRFEGGSLSGAGTVTFTGEVVAPRAAVFASSLTVRMAPHRQGPVYPEWFGAVPMKEPRDSALGGANNVVDSTAAIQRAVDSFTGYAFGTNRIVSATVFLTGWYAITDEIKVTDRTIRLVGNGPAYGGSGLRWVGTPAAGWASKAMLHFDSAADFSVVEGVGFIGVKTTSPATRLLAAIRTSYTSPGKWVQRRITIRNVMIGDTLNYFLTYATAGYEFQNGILSGGPGASNGNDDFHTIDNVLIGFADRGIRVTWNMAVMWTVRNYGFGNGNVMFESETGGQLIAESWYAARSTREGVFKFWDPATGGANKIMRLNVRDFSCEHLQAMYFIRTNMQTHGHVQGDWINFVAADPLFDASQAGTVVTSTTEFFYDSMVGQRVVWDAGSVATITAVTDTTHAVVSASQTVAQGQARIVNTRGEREVHLVYGQTVYSVVNLHFEDMNIDWSELFGTPNPLRRMAIYVAPATGTFNSKLKFTNTGEGATANLALSVEGSLATQNRIVDVHFDNVRRTNGSWTHRATFQRRLAGYELVDANGFVPFSTLANDEQHDVQVDTVNFGAKLGGLTSSLHTRAYRFGVLAQRTLTLPGLLKKGNLYLGVPVLTTRSNMAGTGVLYHVKVGIPGTLERFGRITNSYLIRNTNGMAGSGPLVPAADTDLVLSLYYVPNASPTCSQTATTITCSASAFVNWMPGETIRWTSGANAGATATVATYTDATHVEATGSATVASGTIEVTAPFTTPGDLIVQPTYFSAGDDTTVHSSIRYQNNLSTTTVQ